MESSKDFNQMAKERYEDFGDCIIGTAESVP